MSKSLQDQRLRAPIPALGVLRVLHLGRDEFGQIRLDLFEFLDNIDPYGGAFTMKFRVSPFIVMAFSMALSPMAHAASFIDGNFTFTGAGDYGSVCAYNDCAQGFNTGLTATMLDFGAWNATKGNDGVLAGGAGLVGTDGTVQVDSATGDFLAYVNAAHVAQTLVGKIGPISDFSSLDPGLGGLAVPVHAVALLSVGGFQFDADTITVTDRDTSGLELSGFGTVTGANSFLNANGFLPTPGTFTLGTINRSGTASFKFSFTSAVSGVPESSTWIFMVAGFGMIGFALRRNSGLSAGSLNF